MASILPFIQRSHTFDDMATHAMGEAFDEACEHLGQNLPAAIRDAIARRIIEAAKRGERDPENLCRSAIGPTGR